MKRLYFFLCLFLSLCLLLPASLVSASALVEVDGTYGYLAWWYDDPQDYVSFTNQIVSQSSFNQITVQVDIDLINPIEAKSVFDVELGFNFSNVGSITVTKFQPMNTSNVAIDNLSVSVVNNKISVSDLQYKEDVKFIRVQFLIERPTWVIENAEGNITIAGKTYKFQRSTTWAEWCNSDYDTLGLYVENGKVYGDDVQLKYNGESVNSSDWIVDNGVYTLEPLGSVTTTINFKIKYTQSTLNYSCAMGMTWADWIASPDYDSKTFYVNENGFVTYDGNTFIESNNGWVYGTDVIIQDYTYQATKVLTPTLNSSRGIINYKFDFALTSVSVDIEDEKGLLESILSYLQNMANSIGNAIGNVLKDLFIPNSVRLEDMIKKTLGDYSSKFGVLADSVDIIDNITNAFAYKDTQTTVNMPEVSVMLAGSEFVFGGYEVDVIPDGFESIVDILKVLVNIVATVSFVFSMKRRFTEVLNR